MSGRRIGHLAHVAVLMILTLSAAVLSPRAACAESGSSSGPALKWQKLGASSGRPLIFLPAVGLPGQYWSKVYDQFQATHPIYVVSFAGSGGVPATTPPYFEKIVDGLHELIVGEKLKDPALIGHFLGLQLALRTAAKYPDEVGGVFGLPMASPRPPMNQRQVASENVTADYLKSDPELWLPTMSQQIRLVARNPETVAKLTELIKGTDRETYARMMGEMVADPIEEYLPKVRCPVYLVATIPPQRRGETIEDGQERLAAISQARVDLLRSLYPGLAKCNITALRNVEFYAMMDSANRLEFPLDRFLKRLDDPHSRWESTIPGASSAAPAKP